MIRIYFRVLIRGFLRYVGFLAFGLRFVWEWIVVVGLYKAREVIRAQDQFGLLIQDCDWLGGGVYSRPSSIP